ncbi:Protein N-acetyltransferase, RimJ/RimL family [Tenacibaculum sp. MAR_2010_89]|uniref:GNAT family N-acetyltransferase n=1 Tax=Tenacibaculum sp. MAR_2010_89 TaxID=1250198 RepID=UPI000894D673|nr:GNAT family protein [Tenacibaculum sp. MAR_2010_89]SED68040.1 Protein N-acetyltransferase, RimJ/RimL family [Tenacibaculum sp. MAR_2010_89]
MYKSKRIRLRAFTENDAKLIAEMRSDFEGVKAAGGRPFPTNENSEKEWISKMYPNGLLSNITFAIEENDTNLFVGYCTASNINYINSNAHVGLFFHKQGRGKGYFKEASILFYGYLFNELNLHKVHSYALTYNDIAIISDKKIGFKVEGTMKEHVYQGGAYQDALVLGLLKKDFLEINDLNAYVI